MEGVGFVVGGCGGLTLGGVWRARKSATCASRASVKPGGAGADGAAGAGGDGAGSVVSSTRKQSPQEGWKVGLLAVAGALIGTFGGPMPSRAGIFGSSKLSLNETERVTSGVATVGAGIGFAYLAYKRNRDEDSQESLKIKEEAERLEKWRQEFEEEEDPSDDSVSNEDLMASLRDRLQKKESSPAKSEDVERIERMWKAQNEGGSQGDSTTDTATDGNKGPVSPQS